MFSPECSDKPITSTESSHSGFPEAKRPDKPLRSTAKDVERAMAMVATDIERLIRARLPDAEVTIRDLAGDGDHYAATVISESFRGKSRVQQHQIVYEALKAEMGGKLHALALQTGTPER
jgi:stress-induced morphogen